MLSRCLGFSLFDTPLGPCGIAWSAGGVCGVQLPEADREATRARMQHRFPGSPEIASVAFVASHMEEEVAAPTARDDRASQAWQAWQASQAVAAAAVPDGVRVAIAAVTALLGGDADAHAALLGIPLDQDGVPPFHQRVYALARAIPPGQTRSYGELAHALGAPGAARAVGQALGHNPFAPVVPCHRILASGGRPGGFSAHGGAGTKLRLLEIEGAQFNGPGLFDALAQA